MSMTDDAELLKSILADNLPNAAKPRGRGAPKPDELGLKINSRTGEGTIGVNVADGEDPRWDEQLRFLDLDPAHYEVHGGLIEVRSWDAAVGDGKVERMRYVKAKIRLRDSDDPRIDADELAGWVRRVKPPRRKQHLDMRRADVLCPSDWQLGKAHEQGGGTPETVARVVDSIGKMQDRVAELRKAGHRAGALYIAHMGDPGERCEGHYPSQAYRVDANEREQQRLARWLYMKHVVELAPLYDEVWVSGVASNHGENRSNGKMFTTEDDSVDMMLLEQLAERLADNDGGLGHVNVVVPEDPLVLTWDVLGTGVAHTHGHKATKGGNTAPAKLWTWWDGQLAGRLPAGECDVLVAAHYHHHYRLDQQGRSLLGTPSLDGGSRWFTDTRGIWSPPGTLVFQMEDGDSEPKRVDLL